MDLADLTRDLEALRADALASIDGAPGHGDARRARARRPRQEGPADARPARDRRAAARGPAQGRRRRQRGPWRRSRPRSPSAARRCAARSSMTASPPRPSTSPRPAGRSGAARSTRASRRCARSPRSSSSSGSSTYESPEIEDDVTNFQMLNIPPDHPARDLWDTLYVDVEGHLLRTHTSPGQIRVMQAERPPIRALLPGPLLPLRGDRRQPRLGVLPGRGPDDRRGHDDGRPARASSTSSPRRCSGRTSGRGSGRATTRSRSRRWPSTSSASCAAARAARPAVERAG